MVEERKRNVYGIYIRISEFEFMENSNLTSEGGLNTVSERSLGSGRIEFLDVAKGVAILWVVLGHVIDDCELDHYIYTFHMSFFFLLSGILFRIRTGECFVQFLWRKFRKLMVPYYCFGFLAICAFTFFGAHAVRAVGVAIDFGFFQMCRNLIYGASQNGALKFYEPLWFLSCLFWMQIVSYFIMRVTATISRGNSRLRTPVLLLFVLSVMAADYIFFKYLRLPPLPLSLNMFIRHFPIFLLGGLVQGAFLTVPKEKRFYDFVLSAPLILAGVLAFVFIERFEFLTQSRSFLWFFYFYSQVLISSFGYLFLCRGIRSSRLLEFLGRETLSVLVIHKYPIVLVSVLSPFGARLIRCNNLFFCLPLTLMVAIVSVLVGLPLKRYFPFLYGEGYGRTPRGGVPEILAKKQPASGRDPLRGR